MVTVKIAVRGDLAQRRISSNLRSYVGYQKIPMVLAGMGTVIISTPKGMMTGKQARRERTGGEVVCYVW